MMFHGLKHEYACVVSNCHAAAVAFTQLLLLLLVHSNS